MLRGERRDVLLGGDDGVWLGVAEKDEMEVEDRVRAIWTGEDWVGAGVVRGT